MGGGERIGPSAPLVLNRVLYQAEPPPNKETAADANGDDRSSIIANPTGIAGIARHRNVIAGIGRPEKSSESNNDHGDPSRLTATKQTVWLCAGTSVSRSRFSPDCRLWWGGKQWKDSLHVALRIH